MQFRLLEINLSTHEKKVLDVTEDVRQYLDGRGSPERVMCDSLTLCTFVRPSINKVYGLENYAREMLKAACGWDVSEEKWKDIERRVSYMERCYSMREGYVPERDDILPERFFVETISNNYGEPRALDKEAFLEWRKKLYLSYELTPNGVPPRDFLKKAGMDFVIPTLERTHTIA